MKTLIVAVSVALCATSAFAQQAAASKAAPPPAPASAASAGGMKIAYVDVAAIAGNSAEGKAASAKVNALIQKKQGEAQKQKTPTPQEAQRFQADAQAEVQKLQQDLQNEFQRKLGPVLRQMALDKHLSVLLSAGDAGLVWADPALDLTAEAIKRFDASLAAPKK